MSAPSLVRLNNHAIRAPYRPRNSGLSRVLQNLLEALEGEYGQYGQDRQGGHVEEDVDALLDRVIAPADEVLARSEGVPIERAWLRSVVKWFRTWWRRGGGGDWPKDGLMGG